MIERPPVPVFLAGLLVLFVGIALAISPAPAAWTNSLQRGAEYESEELFPQARAHFQIALARQPYRVDLREKIALLSIQSGDVDSAFQELLTLSKMDALSPQGWHALGDLYYLRGSLADALLAYDRIHPLPPPSSDIGTRILAINLNQKDWKNAIGFLDAHGANQPRYIHYKIGILALDAPESALELVSSLDYPDQNRLTGIISEISKSEVSTEVTVLNYLALGRYFESFVEYDLTEAIYSHTLDLAPESAVVMANMGRFHAVTGIDGKAEIDLALQNDPSNPMVNQLVGEYWLNRLQPEIALAYLKKSSELNPQSDGPLLLLGVAQNQLGDYLAGLGTWEKAAQLSDQPEKIWRQISRFCVDNQIYIREFGLPAIQKLLLTSPDSPENLDLAGQTYLALGDPLNGEKYLRDAIAMDPGYFPAQLHLGTWYMNNGRVEEGRKYLEIVADQQEDLETMRQAQQFLSGE
jgi:tetratricopeptide (TPR) repeat protein